MSVRARTSVSQLPVRSTSRAHDKLELNSARSRAMRVDQSRFHTKAADQRRAPMTLAASSSLCSTTSDQSNSKIDPSLSITPVRRQGMPCSFYASLSSANICTSPPMGIKSANDRHKWNTNDHSDHELDQISDLTLKIFSSNDDNVPLADVTLSSSSSSSSSSLHMCFSSERLLPM
jgi:hypothetical protein